MGEGQVAGCNFGPCAGGAEVADNVSAVAVRGRAVHPNASDLHQRQAVAGRKAERRGDAAPGVRFQAVAPAGALQQARGVGGEQPQSRRRISERNGVQA